MLHTEEVMLVYKTKNNGFGQILLITFYQRKKKQIIIVKDTVRSFNAKNCNFSFLHQHM